MRIGICSLALALSLTTTTSAEVQLDTWGGMEVHLLDVFCPESFTQCAACAQGDADVPGSRVLYAGLGQWSGPGYTQGLAEVTVTPYAIIGGVEVSPSLLPLGSRAVAGTSVNRPGFAWACPDGAIGARIEIDEFAFTTPGLESHFFDLPIRESYFVRIEVCSVYAFVGGGCQHAGSAVYSWRLFAPVVPHVEAIVAGDAPPVAPPGARAVVDFSAGPGGLVTVSRLPEAPLVARGISPVDQWDIRGDMEEASFLADLEFAFVEDELPDEVDPGLLSVAWIDAESGAWELLPTDVDVAGGVATIETSRLGVFVLTPPPPVPVRNASWGEVKSAFAR